MRANLVPTQEFGFTLGRPVFAVALMMAFAFTAQTALAVAITGYDVEYHGNDDWTIVGHVDVDEEAGEIATIDFGGAISGQSTTTFADGTFEHDFSASPGELLSFFATIGSNQSDTEEETLFDPDGE